MTQSEFEDNWRCAIKAMQDDLKKTKSVHLRVELVKAIDNLLMTQVEYTRVHASWEAE